MKPLAKITEQFTESVIREMTRICDAAKGINLSQGFPDFECNEDIKQAAIRAVLNDYNQYPVTYGEPELRQAISQKVKHYNGFECDYENDITVTCGATEAMMSTLKAIINPGDEIIIFEPFYENYGPDCILSGAIPKYMKLEAPHWTYDHNKLAKMFNEKTKAIIINTPNNPTGKVFSKKELQEIAELCIKWDVIAVTDEIYEHIIYDGKKHISIASLPQMKSRTVTVNSLSKTYSVTGWRVGWAITSAEITERIRKVHDFLTVGAPTPFQHAGVEALNFEKAYYDNLREFYSKARTYLYDILNNAGFKCQMPEGSYYIMADISDFASKINYPNDTAFSRRLIELTGVATVPGSAFYSNPQDGFNQVRFTFCKKNETLQDVEQRFETLSFKN